MKGKTNVKTKLFIEGREMYYAWLHMDPLCSGFLTYKDIQRLARHLDLAVNYVRIRIETFLYN
jgi:hypothetical protein